MTDVDPIPARRRPECERCGRPVGFCVCARIPRVEHRTPIVAVQHVRERRHPFGTLRLAALGLERLRVVVGTPVAPRPSLPDGAALLYPGPGAADLESLPPARRPSALVLLDGTWAQSRKLLRVNPWLRALPRVRLRPKAPSRYRIRREPRVECLSTIESLVAALETLEPGTPGLPGLLDAFDGMVDGVVDHLRTYGKRPRFRAAARPRAAHLEPLARARERLLVVTGEGTRRRPDADERHLVAWGAVRPADGSRFLRLVRPPAALSERRLARMDLDADAFRDALDVEEARREWRAFRRPDDVIVAWDPAIGPLLEAIGEESPARPLKQIVNRWSGGARGPLGEQLRALGIAPPRPLGPGRPGRALGAVSALVEHLVRAADV
ncbi:MAG: tRNA-uridine aminocarboxypropyltransferase [Planctomycetota bacterium JB042]